MKNVNYLTESTLGDYLKILFNKEFIHNKVLFDKFKPDYRNDDLRLIIEFDGYNHYTTAKVALRDAFKDTKERELGYQIVRWPYFVQISRESIKYFLNIDVEIEQIYQHGFIDEHCVLPADFCELGIKKFIDDFMKFPEVIKLDIISSLKYKIQVSKYGIYEVVPKAFIDVVDK